MIRFILKTKKAPDEGASVVFRKEKRSFTLLKSPAIHGGDNSVKASVPHRRGGVKATSFLTGFIRL